MTWDPDIVAADKIHVLHLFLMGQVPNVLNLRYFNGLEVWF